MSGAIKLNLSSGFHYTLSLLYNIISYIISAELGMREFSECNRIVTLHRPKYGDSYLTATPDNLAKTITNISFQVHRP